MNLKGAILQGEFKSDFTESRTTGRMTTNPQTMITWLQNIAVNGGGDCAEYAMSGMLKGTAHRHTYDVRVRFSKDMHSSVWIS